MKANLRSFFALTLSALLIVFTTNCGRPAAVAPTVPLKTNTFQSLQSDLQKSYLELFRVSPSLEYTPEQIKEMSDYLNKAQDFCTGEFKKKSDQYQSEIKQAQDKLNKNSKISDTERHDLKCQVQSDQIMQSQAKVMADHAVPVAYQNKQAKLELIQKWPGDLKQIKQEIADGSYLKRRWGDVKDIGFRQIAPGQQDDISLGKQSIEQMKQSGLMPPELDDPAVVDYVKSVGQKVASHSDLKVPLHITVLNSKEINAFALPGGFMFVERGLLEAVDDEAELAGVMGHEMGHVVARHGHKLMQKAEIASIFYQAAEIAAMVLTGGVAGVGTYYALQYGFYGLGLVLNLELLGISREYELQADQLGIQYAWNSGYNPNGFIRFFDKMATEEGYVNGISWFYDHPPFYQRMVDSEREIMFLPKKENLITNTPEFGTMKTALAKVVERVKKEQKAENAPTLVAHETGCPAPNKMEYKPGEPIEGLCNLPGAPQSPDQSSSGTSQK